MWPSSGRLAGGDLSAGRRFLRCRDCSSSGAYQRRRTGLTGVVGLMSLTSDNLVDPVVEPRAQSHDGFAVNLGSSRFADAKDFADFFQIQFVDVIQRQ